MVKAVFIDFYGTVVHEDGAVIRKIISEICNTGIVKNKSDVGEFWYQDFQMACADAYGENFETQRCLEYRSLLKTINFFSSYADADSLSSMMFDHWVKPPIFEDSLQFFNECPVPVYIVSNIDRDDILRAIRFHGLQAAGVFTSEDARAYKPRKEIFELALKDAGIGAADVVHIGDSLSSDINGAVSADIDAVLIDRGLKHNSKNIQSICRLTDIFDTKFFK